MPRPDALAELNLLKLVVARLGEMGYFPAEPENPDWAARGVTIEDPDGWRIVLMNTEGI